ncbi:MAG: UbiA family prenyltransferase, partial [Thermodesulfobacteriota bacterium]
MLAPPFFGGVLFSEADMFFRMVQAFLAFSLVSSAGYIVNDLFDRETDSIHPTKRFRPIASGRVGKGYALLFALLAVFISLLISFGFNKVFFVILISYFILSLAYSSYFQYIVLADVISIAIGFVLRIEGGGFASDVKVSNWLLVMTVMLSLLLALGKRRFELETHIEDS